jgi:quercetin dioxygenase-like cupin family protein
MRRITLDSLPLVEPVVGVRYRAAVHGDRQIRLVEFGAGFREAEWCGKAHVGYVLAGRLEIEFGDAVELFCEGDALNIDAGDLHRARVVKGPVRLFLAEQA